MDNVVILGCGPAGLAAAKAAIDLGFRAIVASATDRPSVQHGCQYLHAPVPGYERVSKARVEYILRGTADQYRLKVYGKEWTGKVSPEDFIGEHDAWDIRQTYEAMWNDLHQHDRFRHIVIKIVKDGVLPDVIYHFNPVKIISTIPARSLCYKSTEHTFRAHVIYAVGTTRPEMVGSPDLIVCDGTDQVEWYRNAYVFGYRTTEWSQRPKNGTSMMPVVKPLETDCDCYPEIHRIGRYGKWQKSYLVHQAYPEVTEILGR